jgi:hypothetical protein
MACLLKGQIIANIGLTYIHTELSLGYYAHVVAGIYRNTIMYRYFFILLDVIYMIKPSWGM